MDKPIVTGAKFGLGFAVVFGVVAFALEYVSLSLVDSLYPEASFGEPQIVRSEPVTRDGVFVVLATVKNTDDIQIAFDAEATVFGVDGEFLDTCYADRSFELAPSAELSFVAICSIGPMDSADSSTQVTKAALQFY